MKRLLVCAALSLTAGVQASASHAETGARFAHLLVAIDCSRSVDPEEFHAVVKGLSDVLPELAVQVAARDVGVLTWAEPGDLKRSAAWIRLPEFAEDGDEPVRLTEGELIFRHARDRRMRVEARLKRIESIHTNEARLRSAAAALQPAIDTLASVAPTRAGCTSVQSALARCVLERPGTLCLLVTDAEETCNAGIAVGSELPRGSSAVVVLLPGGKGTRQGGESPEAWLFRTAPWVRLVHSFQCTGSPGDWLSVALAPQNGESR